MTTAAPPEPPQERVGLSTNAAGRAVPSAWERARSRMRAEDPFVGWAGSISVALLALFLRLWHLGQPRVFEFDETYYAKDGWSLLHYGYARDYVTKANEHILAGQTTGQWKDTPEMAVHPDVGKWLIALGEKAFGMDPFGWRVSAAVVGALMVLVMCRLARRLTGSTLLGCIAGLLLCFDGLHFVLSRLALLDIFVAFFILCGVHCIVADRDWHRARMARLVPEQLDGRAWGPVRGLLFRPWLVAAGVAWGLACGTKWEAVYPMAAFGLLAWVWSAGARRSFGVRWSVPKSVLADGIPAFVQIVLVGLVVYVASWTGWLVNAHQYEENLSSTQYTRFVAEGKTCDDPAKLNDDRWPTAGEPDAHGLGEVTQSLRSLWYYHHDVYEFHTHFLNCSSHTYASKPSGWLLLNRPVGVAADTDIQPGTQGCDAPAGSTCLRQVLLLGSPTIWWAGCLALLLALVTWIGARDWRYGVVVVGAASTWLPWLQYDDRPIFSFYAVITLPFMVLAITMAIGRILGRSTAPSPRRTAGVVVVGAYLVLVLLNFAWFWPIWTNQLLTHSEWLDRIWFSRWI
ncbi:dolichyl-phosphate-mannose--protein mannosyltransferase [Nocardioides conyzicola]|uniref:Polyprenol-phosphate-mannose--protein mannosyltransferase n=1 Tax=Nocardioides conyzicola TaxID=1651781 RepID=A0ABP8X1W1_9ACTN